MAKTYFPIENKYDGSEFLNISFVANDSSLLFSSPIEWRGKLLFKAIKKNRINTSHLFCYDDFSKGDNVLCEILNSSQLFILEASLRNDFIEIINFLKSKNKKVVVDIPYITDILELTNIQSNEQKPLSSRLFSSQQVYNSQCIDEKTSFRWALNLADNILVTSDKQYEKWQCCTPIKIFPELFDASALETISSQEHEITNLGIFLIGNEIENIFFEFLEFIDQKFKNVVLNFINIPQFGNSFEISQKIDKTYQTITDLNQIQSMDVGVFWDTQLVRGIFTRNILEFLYKKKPIIINNTKGYLDLAKYGLIIEENQNWKSDFADQILNYNEHSSALENGYLYSISRSVDDNINPILRHFSEIMKVS